MTKYEFSITLNDERGRQRRQRIEAFTKPTDYETALEKLKRTRDCHVHIRTITVVTLYPEKTVGGLFD